MPTWSLANIGRLRAFRVRSCKPATSTFNLSCQSNACASTLRISLTILPQYTVVVPTFSSFSTRAREARFDVHLTCPVLSLSSLKDHTTFFTFSVEVRYHIWYNEREEGITVADYRDDAPFYPGFSGQRHSHIVARAR